MSCSKTLIASATCSIRLGEGGAQQGDAQAARAASSSGPAARIIGFSFGRDQMRRCRSSSRPRRGCGRRRTAAASAIQSSAHAGAGCRGQCGGADRRPRRTGARALRRRRGGGGRRCWRRAPASAARRRAPAARIGADDRPVAAAEPNGLSLSLIAGPPGPPRARAAARASRRRSACRSSSPC